MIDLSKLSIEGTTRTFTFKTSLGEAVLEMRLIGRDNAVFVGDFLGRERKAAAEPAPPDGKEVALAVAPEAALMSAAIAVEGLGRQAADLHRWCFKSLTVGGETCTHEQGLQFLTVIATEATTVFVEISTELNVIAKTSEASSDAIAGESSPGSST